MSKLTIIVNSLTLCHKSSEGIAQATLPDVCKTPRSGGPVPIPYPNVARSLHLSKGSKTIQVDGGNMAAIKGSEFSVSTGDEAGTVGGIKSSVNTKEATWLSYSPDVKFEGKNVCRLTDKMLMNHGNTVCLAGEAQEQKSAKDAEKRCEIVCPKKGPHETSEEGKKFIKKREKFESKPYNDLKTKGNCTIGYGYKIHKGICTAEDYKSYADGWTEKKAAEEFGKKLKEFENYVNRYVKVNLNQNQFDALVSLVYNAGPGNFKNSDLLTQINNSEFDKASETFKKTVVQVKVKENVDGKEVEKSIESDGVANRRKEEASLFSDKNCPAQACECCKSKGADEKKQSK